MNVYEVDVEVEPVSRRVGFARQAPYGDDLRRDLNLGQESEEAGVPKRRRLEREASVLLRASSAPTSDEVEEDEASGHALQVIVVQTRMSERLMTIMHCPQ